MNSIEIEKSLIEKCIANMNNIINKKYSTTLDITTNIMIETIDENLILKATDYELDLKITAPINAKKKIKFAVNGESINNILKTLNDGELTITQESENIIIKQNKTSFKIPIVDITDFPFNKSYLEMEKLEIDSKKLLNAFKKVMHSCNEKDDNIAIQGILVESINKTLSIVATDTKRMAFIRESIENNDFDFILPKKALLEAIKIFNDDFDFYIGRKQDGVDTICITNATHEFYAKTLRMKFPDYKKLLEDKKPKVEPIVIKKENLLKSINQINAICQRLKIVFNGNEATLETIEGMNGSSASISIGEVNNPFDKEIKIAFTNRHLLDYLSTIKTESIEILIDDPNSAVFFLSSDLDEVIMPRIL